MDEQDLYDAITEWIESINNCDAVVLVEGKNDRKAIIEIGVTVPIVLVNQGLSIPDLCDHLKIYGKEIIILTDWDSKGNQLAESIEKLLVSYGIKFNTEYKRMLKKFTYRYTSSVQDIHSIYENLKKSVKHITWYSE